MATKPAAGLLCVSGDLQPSAASPTAKPAAAAAATASISDVVN